MTTEHQDSPPKESAHGDWAHQDWPQRTWALAIIGAIVGVLIYLISELPKTDHPERGYAMAAFLIVSGVAFAFVVERDKIRPAALFACIAGLVMGFTVFWNGGPYDWESWEGWRVVTSALTVAIAAPLFQAWGDSGVKGWPRLADLSYPQLHDRSWTNVVLWFACWLFVGIVWALAFLIGSLFDLIGIDLLRQMMSKLWFGLVLTGASFGAAAGLLRDREKILVTLQTVVRRVLGVLAPVLGAGLVLFLIATLFTGLAPLWQATKATTPILVSTVIAAIILANAAIGDSAEDEAKLKVIRWGTAALGVVILPLGLIAAVSTGLRIAQYGLTPDRLWAVVGTGIACAYGLAYLTAVVRKRADWMAGVRPANVRLALGLCALAFLLSTPFVNFGVWSTVSQVARLESGKISSDQFDWALKFDFGPSGAAAVKRLAKSGQTAAVRLAATAMDAQPDRWSGNRSVSNARKAQNLEARMTILPTKTPLPDYLRKVIVDSDTCPEERKCVVLYAPGARSAVGVSEPCDDCEVTITEFEFVDGKWERASPYNDEPSDQRDARRKRQSTALRGNQVEIREVTRRQLFIGGEPAGDILE
jgi:hypothetical protein